MISQLRLKSASSPGQAPLVVDNPIVTIFVGPNNSGKSLALREIFHFCNTGVVNVASAIVEKLIFEAEDSDKVQSEFEEIKKTPRLAENVGPGDAIVEIGGQRFTINEAPYLEVRRNPNSNPSLFVTWYLRYLTLNLDGPSRIGLAGQQPTGDLKNPQNALARLLTNDEKRIDLRRTIHDAFGLYFAIDISHGGQLHIRFGASEPPDERSIRDDTLEYMRTARGIDAVSDGVKAYTGVLLHLRAGDPKITIIDEPEAFLHPSLAFSLGKELAKAAATEEKHVFVATHDPQFVMGAVLSGARVNIIRLTYEGGKGTARLLPSTELTQLMQDPLLRSVGLLSGLFYKHVIVCEANADRAFYQEINERLLAAGDLRGITNTLFLNADSKQSIPRIIEPLRKLGIPAAAVVDIDVLKDGGTEWIRHLKACNVPMLDQEPLASRRSRVLSALQAKNSEFKSGGGIALLERGDLEAAENLLLDLARYGLFVVPRGEVENWLASLDVPRSKGKWLHSIFEKMGNDPGQPDYVTPTSGDVWDFIGQIGAWSIDPSRRGIPG